MPLHLLHHKSWHVYNSDNIERVRRDEAAAEAREIAEARRQNDADAAHRIETLRARTDGEPSHTAPGLEQPSTKQKTDLDRRVDRLGLTGRDGRFNLFPEAIVGANESTRKGNVDYEREKREREETCAAQYRMGLGKAVNEAKPWYSSLDGKGGQQSWREGREKREEWGRVKEERRKEWADPMAAIKRGVKEVREVNREKEEWMRQRERDVCDGASDSREEMRNQMRRRKRRQRRERSRSPSRESRKRNRSREDGHRHSHRNTHHAHASSLPHSHRHIGGNPARHPLRK